MDAVGEGAVQERVDQKAAVASPEAWRLERSRTPGAARVAATVVSDAAAVIVSACLAAALAGTLAGLPVLGNLYDAFPGGSTNALLLVGLTPWWLFMLYAFGLYREPGRSIGGTSVAGALDGLTALTAASWFILVVLVVALGESAPAASLIVFWAIAIVATPALRWVGKTLFWWRPSFAERTLIVGAGSVGHLLAEKIAKHPEFRVRLVGFLDDGAPVRGGDGPIFPVVGTLDDLGRVIEQMKVTRVIVAFSRARHPEVLNVVRTCADYGVKVNIVPRLFEVVSTRAGVDDVEGIPLLDVGPVELGRFNMFVKRVFDLTIGTVMLLLGAPLLLATALAIKLDSRGPVFFRQERMGRGGRVFRIYKFRSMYAGAELQRRELEAQNEYSGPMFKMKVDPRVTRVGSYIRRWSLDELPQLLNVMTGDMSLVGPRPLWVEEARQCRGWTRKRLDITPGITGLWQVLGRNSIPFDEMVKLDYMYVTGWSLSWDVKLLLETVPAVLAKRGAY
jgi:exopolysaccharide biosynthesis polyprenyl glycosylphosphotransferase